jgi:hypothetical protein
MVRTLLLLLLLCVSSLHSFTKYFHCHLCDNLHFIITTGVAGTAYLACDDEPVTREEICAAALASGRFPGLKMPKVSHDKY